MTATTAYTLKKYQFDGKTIAITGHRPNKLPGVNYDNLFKDNPFRTNFVNEMSERIGNVADKLGSIRILSGMALGIDLYWFEAAYKARSAGHNVQIVACVPCLEQDKLWSNTCKSVYRYCLEKADLVVYTSKMKYRSPQQMRNRNIFMVDNCDLLISVFDGSVGGTSHCTRYAQSIGKRVMIFKPDYFVK